ncbi:MAG TPA: GNAT family N-acetyltransferase [Bryobacteraceae bacterium]
MDLRPYSDADRDACGALADRDFPARDRPAFETFLASPGGPFFVMEHEGRVVGCGGYVMEAEDSLATLVWGMIRPEVRRQGLGRYLLMYCLREIGKAGGIDRVRVETSKDVAGFYERQGFRVASINGDRVELVKRLSVCS